MGVELFHQKSLGPATRTTRVRTPKAEVVINYRSRKSSVNVDGSGRCQGEFYSLLNGPCRDEWHPQTNVARVQNYNPLIHGFSPTIFPLERVDREA